jgi:hypothetical protein
VVSVCRHFTVEWLDSVRREAITEVVVGLEELVRDSRRGRSRVRTEVRVFRKEESRVVVARVLAKVLAVCLAAVRSFRCPSSSSRVTRVAGRRWLGAQLVPLAPLLPLLPPTGGDRVGELL